ncbi:MAG: formiminotetrahydrofolate cyclodeaminase [Candidatus Azotimanducaceae bacterium]|jgi:formiminotetrahydrofolate cyclodeaminase
MLTNQTIETYLQQLAGKTSTPGGGAAAGISGAQAAALLGMVAQFSQQPTLMQTVIDACDRSAGAFMRMAQEDITGFKAVMTAYGLPATDSTSKQQKQIAVQEALGAAVAAPLAMIDEAMTLIALAQQLQTHGNKNLITDVGIAASLLLSCLQSSQLNLRVNLRSIKTQELIERCQAQLLTVQQGVAACQQLIAAIDTSLI